MIIIINIIIQKKYITIYYYLKVLIQVEKLDQIYYYISQIKGMFSMNKKNKKTIIYANNKIIGKVMAICNSHNLRKQT